MSDPLPLGKRLLLERGNQVKQAVKSLKSNSLVFAMLTMTIFGLMVRFLQQQPTFYAQAYSGGANGQIQMQGLNSPLFEQKNELFEDNKAILDKSGQTKVQPKAQNGENSEFAEKIYSIVGDAPIKEMVPYISQRDQRVAAFLVGIAQKESSFGLASPSRDGQTCYNYWGYKGEGGRGTSMGYACFASAQEAVETVGNRIQTLVEKEHNTPAKMVDTWKCGRSCAGDPGAPGWVSTVALYFEKIVG